MKVTIPTMGAGADVAVRQAGKRKVIFRNCAQFTDCISKISNTQIDNENDLDAVMLMYTLVKILAKIL